MGILKLRNIITKIKKKKKQLNEWVQYKREDREKNWMGLKGFNTEPKMLLTKGHVLYNSIYVTVFK